MRLYIKKYIWSCPVCCQAKPVRHKPYGLLQPLPVATQPWTAIQMDFIKKLPPSFGYDAILVIVDCDNMDFSYSFESL